MGSEYRTHRLGAHPTIVAFTLQSTFDGFSMLGKSNQNMFSFSERSKPTYLQTIQVLIFKFVLGDAGNPTSGSIYIATPANRPRIANTTETWNINIRYKAKDGYIAHISLGK